MRFPLCIFVVGHLWACRTGTVASLDSKDGIVSTVDADNDGVTADQDCDDTAPGVYPGAAEVCNGIDDDCDGIVDEGVNISFFADADGDGFGDPTRPVDACEPPLGTVSNNTDCDDDDASIYVGAPERCDDKDNDCNGTVDDDVRAVWYSDTDGDGYGDPLVTAESCDPPSGFVADNTDCNDASARAYPDAIEICDNLDNDCDGDIDGDAIDSQDVFEDTDADGFGNPSVVQSSCTIPAGWSDIPTDCDDTRADAYPGAPETCNALDDDCDTDVDENAIDAPTWYIDADSDGFGTSTYVLRQCEPPAGYVSDSTDCDDFSSENFPGADEWCDGADNDCDGTTDEDDALDAPTWYTDADADGFGDIAAPVVACAQPSGTTTDTSDCDDTNATAFVGSTATEVPFDGIDQDCDGIDACTDLNCDGIPDIFVPNHYSGSSYTANQQLFYGDGSDFSATADATVSATGAYDSITTDINGDGYIDIIVFDYYGPSGYSSTSYVYWGSAAGHSAASVSTFPTYGTVRGAVADLNGDGYTDIVTANHYAYTYNTSSWVYYGNAAGTYSTTSRTSLTTYGAYDVDTADFDQDGYLDVVFCNHRSDGSYNVNSFVYYGTATGISTTRRADLPTTGCLDLEVTDLDGDGWDDILFANHYRSGVGYSTTSIVYYGASTGFSTTNTDTFPTVGASSVATGDFDGDGTQDVAFASLTTGTSTSTNASVYYNSATGFSTTAKDTLPHFASYDIEAADLNNDGYDDLVIPTYNSPTGHASVSSVYYGSASGFSTYATLLSTTGASRVTIGDLDRDGFPELVFNNYYSGSWASIPDTAIYWGTAAGYTETQRTDLDTLGSWPTVRMVGNTAW